MPQTIEISKTEAHSLDLRSSTPSKEDFEFIDQLEQSKLEELLGQLFSHFEEQDSLYNSPYLHSVINHCKSHEDTAKRDAIKRSMLKFSEESHTGLTLAMMLNVPFRKNSEFNTALINSAIKHGEAGILNTILINRFNDEERPAVATKALSTAVRTFNNQFVILDVLYNNGADKEFMCDEHGATVVFQLVKNGAPVSSVDTALRHGVDGDKEWGFWNMSPLTYSIIWGSGIHAESLIKGGCQVNYPGKDFWNQPLTHAAQHGQPAVALLLIENGATVDSRFSEQRDLVNSTKNVIKEAKRKSQSKFFADTAFADESTQKAEAAEKVHDIFLANSNLAEASFGNFFRKVGLEITGRGNEIRKESNVRPKTRRVRELRTMDV